MALNTSFFYFIILWKGHADVMVDGPSGRGFLRGLSLTAAMPLPGAAKAFTTALRASEMHAPFGGWRHHLPPAEQCY